MPRIHQRKNKMLSNLHSHGSNCNKGIDGDSTITKIGGNSASNSEIETESAVLVLGTRIDSSNNDTRKVPIEYVKL